MLGTLAKVVLRARERTCFLRQSLRKLDIMNHYHCNYSLLATTSHPGVQPASEGEASPPNTMVLKHIIAPSAGTTLLSEVSRNKLQMQQPSFQKWGFARAKHQGPWCLLFLWCAPCWWLGSADRGIFAKVLRRSGRKSKCILKGVAP
jgi:hypothetical protein